MASVEFAGDLWLNSVTDDTDAMSFSINGLSHSLATNVSIRPNAASEQRAVSTPGRAKGAKVALNFCTDVQTEWLKTHQGLPVWYRDGRGEKFAAFYTPDSDYEARQIGDSWVVPVTFTAYTQPDLL